MQYAFVGLLAIAGSTMMALQWLLLAVLPAAAAECQAAAVILSPGARVDSGREVKLSDAGGAGCEACWELTHPALAPIGGCFEAGTTVDVALPANGGYVARLRLRDVATQAVVAEAMREFVAGPPEKCAARLRARSGLATNYREAIEREGRRAFGVEGNGSAVQRSEVYIDREASPLCYGVVGTSREAVLGTASGARGFWGVDFGRQEFGHGDRILLDFVLSRHRADVRNIAEFGTGGGITSFYLGVAAALRGGTLDTFDVVAPRLPQRGLLLVHDFTPHAGPGPTTHQAWAEALAPQGFSRFYRDYGDTFWSSLAVFARPADFDDFLAEGARAIV